jgi:hypothetical protein
MCGWPAICKSFFVTSVVACSHVSGLLLRSSNRVTAGIGTKRQIADEQKFGRFRSEADIWSDFYEYTA